jgi:penicillin-binding protein-related factor A (putative recombinase)
MQFVFGDGSKKPKSKDGPEKILQDLVAKSIRHTFPKNSYMRKTHPDVFEGKGKPDLVGHIIGVHVEIELKSGSRLSPEQIVELRKVHNTGGLSFILIFNKTDTTYYLIPGNIADRFSLKDKTGWTILPVIKTSNGETLLDMRILTAFLITHVASLMQRLI